MFCEGRSMQTFMTDRTACPGLKLLNWKLLANPAAVADHICLPGHSPQASWAAPPCWADSLRPSDSVFETREVDGRGLTRVLTLFLPPLRDKAHDGVLCTSSTRTSAEQQLDLPEVFTVRRVTLLQPVRWASVLGHLSSLRPHWLKK